MSESSPVSVAGRVLVVGGTGLIGSHLLASLDGCERVALARQVPAERARVPGVRYLAGSALDAASWSALPAADYGVYLAGTTSNYLDDPVATVRLATEGLQRFLDWGRDARGLVFVSSGRVYGRRAEPTPLVEVEPVRLRSPDAGNVYDGAKLAGEALAIRASRTTRVVVVRPGNVYGRWLGRAPATSLTDMIAQASRSRRIVLAGAAGSTRSHVHARDVAHGIARALERGRGGAAYNLAGTHLTNLAFARLVAGAFSFPVEVSPPEGATADHMVLSGERAEAELGYRPTCDAARFVPETVREILERTHDHPAA